MTPSPAASRPKPSLLHGHCAEDLTQAPELAALAVLDSALCSSIAALEAAHHKLLARAWDPDAPSRLRLAAAISASAPTLRRLLVEYEGETLSHIVNDVSW